MHKKKYMFILGGVFVFTCFIAGILSIALNYMKSSRKLELRELEEQVNAGSKQLQFYVKVMSSHLIRIERYLSNTSMKVDQELYRYLDFARSYYTDALSEILILDANGNVVAGTNPSSLHSSYGESEYFKDTQNTFNKIYLSKAIMISHLNKEPDVSSELFHDPLDLGWVLYTGVYSKGVFKGAVLFILRSEPFFNRYSMALSKLASGYGFILQNDGRILFHRNVEFRGQFLSDLPDSEYMAQARDLVKKTKQNGFRYRVTGQHIMVASDIYLPNQIWTVGVFITKSKLAQKPMTFIYTLSGLALVLGTIIFGLVFALIRLGQTRDALRRNEEKLMVRNQIANIFLTVPDNKMYGAVLDIVLNMLKSKYGVFGYIDDDGALVCPSMTKDIWDRCQITDKDIIFPEHTWGTSIWGNGLRTKKSAYANQPFNVPEGHIPVDRCLTVPLVYQNKSIGLFSVANKSTDYTDSDKQTLEEIAEYVAPVLHARIKRMHTENMLNESQKRFKDVTDSINDLIMLLGPDFRIQLVNAAVAKAFKIPTSEFTGQYCYKLLYGRNDICECCPMIKALNSRDVTSALRYRPNGQIWDRMVYPVFDDNGNVTGATVIGSDITEKKRSEEALRRSEEKYRTLLETTSEGCWMLNADLKTIEVNQALCKMLGYNQDEMIGKTPFEFADPENRKILVEQTSKISTTSHRSYEITLKKKDGQDLHTYFNASTIRDEMGEVQGSFAFVTDITQRKKAEEERNRLAVAIEQASDSVFITDENGIIQYVNPTFERLTGYHRQEAMGKNPGPLKSGKHDALFYKKMRETLSRGNAWRGHIVNKKKDGSFYESDATISPVFDKSGKITNFVSIKRDVTHELELEKRLIQAQKMEAIGTLAAGIAHDFNNVLYSIIGYAELTMDDLSEDSLARNNLKELLIASNRAKDMVQQILTFSRQAETQKKPVKVQSIAEEAIRLLKTSIPATIEICQNIDADCEPVLADPTQIHQVVMNLATNAYYAMRKQGGVLNINVTTEEIGINTSASDPDFNRGTYIKLTVSDTGHGMNQAVLEKIFDPYFTTKLPGQGTGMGLSTVHGIVKSHGGAIKVYSKPDKGTVFDVYFPVIETKIDESKPVSPGIIQKGYERILLVDDQEQIVSMVKQMSERMGYEVTARTSSVDALEAFKAGSDRFDLVITDMTMPNMTGVELATQLIEIRRDIPIILCTGFSDLTDTNKAKAQGIREFLMKPIFKDQIARTVRNVLDEKIA